METPLLLLGKESDANIVDGRDSAPRGKKFLDVDDDDAPLHNAITTAIPTRKKIIDRVGIGSNSAEPTQPGAKINNELRPGVFTLFGGSK
jgi:hypothetical protein